MRILSLLILYAGLFFTDQKTESPHGSDFKISCKTCHSSKGWQIDKENYSFNHNTTKMALVGQHTVINCRQCHTTLIFSEAKTECVECHKDIHQSTVGPDCSRCHTPASWLVRNITEIHQMSRFPLVGAHRTADCIQCHKSESLVRFDVLGVKCIDCHRENYLATSNPNHIQSGFSEECSTCHPVNSFQWAGAGFSHSFFALELGHAKLACAACHAGGNYNATPTDCFSCHQSKYNNSTNPNHIALAFSTTCTQCHSTAPGWKPASYTQHDAQFFPIYSGSHRGRWSTCVECHSNPANYSLFDCINCHKNAHRGESYTNAECYGCHRTGTAD